jgi:hypothetical protein
MFVINDMWQNIFCACEIVGFLRKFKYTLNHGLGTY